jgi:SutA-like transcriptional regulator
MIDRAKLTVTSREQLRREIAQQTEMFLRRGGNIDVLFAPRSTAARPVGPVWWDTRGSGSSIVGF